jgi:hypothetical protein
MFTQSGNDARRLKRLQLHVSYRHLEQPRTEKRHAKENIPTISMNITPRALADIALRLD